MNTADTEGPGLRSALRGLEIFAGITEEQLDWLVSVSQPRVLADGDVLFRDGEEATGFHILLSGGLVVTKVVDGREEVLTRHSTEEESAAADDHDGKPSAAHRFTGELPLLTDGSYVATAAASGPSTTVVAYPKPVFFEMLTRCHGVAAVLIPVLAWRIKSSEVQARKRATVEALGTLAAGLAHELNNPAAAVARAAQELAPALERLTRTAQAWGAAASGAERAVLDRIAEELDKLPPPVTTDPFAQADAEEEIADWAEDAGTERPGLLGSGVADLGLELGWLVQRLEGGSAGPRPRPGPSGGAAGDPLAGRGAPGRGSPDIPTRLRHPGLRQPGPRARTELPGDGGPGEHAGRSACEARRYQHRA